MQLTFIFFFVAHKAWRLSLDRGSSKRIEKRIYLTSTSSEVKFCNMLQDFISCFNSKWPYFTMFVSSTLPTERIQHMLSFCGTLCVRIFPFSFITTGTKFWLWIPHLLQTVIKICTLHVLFVLLSSLLSLSLSSSQRREEDEKMETVGRIDGETSQKIFIKWSQLGAQ